MEWCCVFVRFVRQLDWDCIWHQLGDSPCYRAAPRDRGTWATAIPDIYSSPEPCHQGKTSLFQNLNWFSGNILVKTCNRGLTRSLAIPLEDFHVFIHLFIYSIEVLVKTCNWGLTRSLIIIIIIFYLFHRSFLACNASGCRTCQKDKYMNSS
jgi:hypothetical protein